MPATTTRRIPSDFRLCEGATVELRAVESTSKETGKRRFTMVAYSGAAVDRWGDKMVVDLAGLSIPKGKRPILRQHDPNNIVGYGDAIENDGTKLVAEGDIIEELVSGREVIVASDNGFPWQASIGFKIERGGVMFVDQGDDEHTVNGRKFKGPGYIVTKSRLREISFVPEGADSNTSGTVLAGQDGSENDLVEVEHEDSTMFNNKDAVEKFAAANPEAVQHWTEEGHAKGLAVGTEAGTEAGEKKAQERFAELQKEFSERPAFVCEQFAAGHDLPTAKAALADVLKVELEAKDKLIAEHEKKEEGLADGHEGVGQTADKGDKPSTGNLSAEDQADKDWDADTNKCRENFGQNKEGYVRFVVEEFRQAELKAERKAAVAAGE